MNIMEICVTLTYVCVLNCLVWMFRKRLDGFPETLSVRGKVYMALLPCVTIAATLLFIWRSGEIESLITVRLITVIVLLWVIALIDFREKIIPDRILVIALIVRCVLIPVEFLIDRGSLLSELFWDVTGCLVMLMFLGLMRIISRILIKKNGIGMGDIKLLCVISLYLGLTVCLQLMFNTMIAAFFWALYLLIFKKAKKEDSIPFAPSILIGAILLTVSMIF